MKLASFVFLWNFSTAVKSNKTIIPTANFARFEHFKASTYPIRRVLSKTDAISGTLLLIERGITRQCGIDSRFRQLSDCPLVDQSKINLYSCFICSCFFTLQFSQKGTGERLQARQNVHCFVSMMKDVVHGISLMQPLKMNLDSLDLSDIAQA